MSNCMSCHWQYEEHCTNGLSDKCTEMVWEDDFCTWYKGEEDQ